jgi:Spy/CpxP family protein refolding chaperone
MGLKLARIMTAGFPLVLTTVLAHAQGPPGMAPPGGPSGQSLLMAESVQKELVLTDKQKTSLRRLEQSMRQKGRDAFEAAREEGMDPEAMRATMNGIRRDHDVAVAKILDKRQKARLTQIELQRDGLLAVANKEFATKIKLTSTQAKKVKSIINEMYEAQASLMPNFPGGPPGGGGFRGGPPPDGGPPTDRGQAQNRRRPRGDGQAANGGPPPGGEGFPGGPPPGEGRGPGGGGPPGGGPGFDNPEFRAQFEKMRESQEKVRPATSKKIEELLTKDQKAAVDKLFGKPFDFSTIRRGPGGPPPGGPDSRQRPGESSKARSESDQ